MRDSVYQALSPLIECRKNDAGARSFWSGEDEDAQAVFRFSFFVKAFDCEAPRGGGGGARILYFYVMSCFAQKSKSGLAISSVVHVLHVFRPGSPENVQIELQSPIRLRFQRFHSLVPFFNISLHVLRFVQGIILREIYSFGL